MVWKKRMAAGVVMVGFCVASGRAQSRMRGVDAAQASSTRYFEVRLVLRLPASAGRKERVESLTTDLAVIKDRPRASSCRARLISQVPVTMQRGPTYLDIGTKLDCNDVRMEGNALAMGVVLETSSVNGMVTTVDKDGKSLQEPLIAQRNISLQVKLPLGKPTVIFNSRNMEASGLRPLEGGPKPLGSGTRGEVAGAPGGSEMEVEMMARELP